MMLEKSPLLVAVQFGQDRGAQRIAELMPERSIIDWYSDQRPDTFNDVKYALLWKFDPDLFDQMPDLEVIFSAGAGVDKIMAADHVPDIPIVRFVDPTLTTRMSEWVVMHCLMHLRQQKEYDAFQSENRWQGLPQLQASDVTVGIMGMGVLGQDAATKLKVIGFNVIGWSRTKKEIEGIPCYDQSELEEFLSKTHFLVGLLPLTAETTGFFKRSVFEQLSRHPGLRSPVFINAGRGMSQVEADIAACLYDGTLGGASLDVFETEPLSPKSALWQIPNVFITPHVAADSDISALARHVDAQIRRHEAGEPLEHLVDRQLGY